MSNEQEIIKETIEEVIEQEKSEFFEPTLTEEENEDEVMEEHTDLTAELGEDENPHVLTEEDMENNPGFEEAGLEVGDEIGIPDEA